jgi:hypothetical protein
VAKGRLIEHYGYNEASHIQDKIVLSEQDRLGIGTVRLPPQGQVHLKNEVR